MTTTFGVPVAGVSTRRAKSGGVRSSVLAFLRSAPAVAPTGTVVWAPTVAAPIADRATGPGPDPVPADVALVVRRFTFGPRPETAAEVEAVGVPAWFAQQLNPAAIDDSACDRILDEHDWRGAEVGRLVRAVNSRRQLLEVMVDVWGEWFAAADDHVLRSHALGRFADLLATAASPDQFAAPDHPSTADRVALRLCERFVAPAPPPAVVDRIAAAYLASGTSIAASLQALFDGPELWSPPPVARGPFELVAAALRAMSARIRPSAAVAGLVAAAGAQAWRTTGRLATASVDGVAVDHASLLADPAPTTGGALVDRVCQRLLITPRAPRRAVVLASAGLDETMPLSATELDRVLPGLVNLCFATVEFQHR